MSPRLHPNFSTSGSTKTANEAESTTHALATNGGSAVGTWTSKRLILGWQNGGTTFAAPLNRTAWSTAADNAAVGGSLCALAAEPFEDDRVAVSWTMHGVLQRPLLLGATYSVHSATKYLGGHGTTLAGVVVESGQFPWDNGKFPGMTEPSRGYHGVRFYETFGDFGYTMKARMEIMRTFGPALSPMNA